jgi:hypothetical protein
MHYLALLHCFENLLNLNSDANKKKQRTKIMKIYLELNLNGLVKKKMKRKANFRRKCDNGLVGLTFEIFSSHPQHSF